MASAAFTAQKWLVVRSPDLQEDSARGTLTLLSAVVATTTLLVAFVVAVAIPAVGLWALLLLVPSGVVEGRISRRRAGVRPVV